MSFHSRFADNTNPDSVSSRLRRRRFELFERITSKLGGRISVLDVGGTPRYWQMLPPEAVERLDITLVNLSPLTVAPPGFTCRTGDARDLVNIEDRSFDVVFSNSVIEHVGTFDDQRRMANEVRRVGRCYYVQTPNFWFPVEPHFQFPGFQFLPVAMRVALLRRFDLGWYERCPDAGAARREIEAIRLLTRRDVQKLFPEATLFVERYVGLAKSFVAYTLPKPAA